MWEKCPQQYKLNYVTPVQLDLPTSNINLLFGNAMHETIQNFLKVMYGTSKKEAMSIDLESYLKERMRVHFIDEKEKGGGNLPASKEEMNEYFDDGKEILKFFKSKIDKFYTKSGIELVGIELKLDEEVKEGVSFIGYIDVILYDKVSGEYIIIDLKTSTTGWSDYKKNDSVTTSQMLIYKKLYSEKFNVPMSKIKVEYQIMKRKLFDDSQYPIPRISKFVPASGKPTVLKAWHDFYQFVDKIFDENGNRRTDDTLYTPEVSKQCEWCPFMETKICEAWKN